MAVIEETLYTVLSGDAGVSALISTRVYPNVIPQDAALPAVAYQRISARRVRSHSGASNLARPRFQIVCVAEAYDDASGLANAVRTALDAYRDTANDPPFYVAFIENEVDEFSDTSDLYFIRQDYFIWHGEDV